jgi:hypothetical protein
MKGWDNSQRGSIPRSNRSEPRIDILALRPRTPKKTVLSRCQPTTPLSPKAIDAAVSAYLPKCGQIADPEVARFGQLSPTPLLKAQQAKIPHEKSKGLRAGSNPSKRGLIIRRMLTPPDRPLRSCAPSEDVRDSTMIYIRLLGAAPDDIERDFDVALFERTP